MTGNVVQIRRHDLRQGDCVRLKSGGPLMLLGIADPEIMDTVTCVWFGGPRGRKLRSAVFRAKTLDLVVRGDQA